MLYRLLLLDDYYAANLVFSVRCLVAVGIILLSRSPLNFSYYSARKLILIYGGWKAKST